VEVMVFQTNACQATSKKAIGATDKSVFPIPPKYTTNLPTIYDGQTFWKSYSENSPKAH
jgi:hypothetical protein